MTQTRLQVLVVDDDPSIRRLFVDLVAPQADCEILSAASAEEGLQVIEEHRVDVAFVDLKLGGMDGLEFIEKVRARPESPEVALITGFGDMSVAVRAMKAGAFDCIPKPFKPTRIVTILEQFRRFAKLKEENRFLRSQLREEFSISRYLGVCPEVKRVRELAAQAAQTAAPVLLSGESGVGRRHLAQAIHYSGDRADSGFVVFDADLYREDARELVLLGDRDDALLRQAEGGTLLILEIGQLDTDLQASLCSVLHENSSSARWIATTSIDLREAVNRGKFDPELYQLISVSEIAIPPLRDRGDDIELLAYRFLDKLNERRDKVLDGFGPTAMSRLRSYTWPGNVHELEAVVEAASEQAKGSLIQAGDLPDTILDGTSGASSRNTGTDTRNLQDMEKEAIRATLEETNGDTAIAARILGIDRSTLYRKLKRYDMGLPRTGRVKP